MKSLGPWAREESMRVKRNDQRGASAVEFALILPVLFVLGFGIIEFSVALYDKAMITNASREGARAGIVFKIPPVTDEEIGDVVNRYLGNQSHHLWRADRRDDHGDTKRP